MEIPILSQYPTCTKYKELIMQTKINCSIKPQFFRVATFKKRHIMQTKTRWKPRTRMYSRSWTTSANLCNGKTNFFLHTSCAHIVSAKAPEQQFTKKQLTSTTTSPPAQRNHHQHNNITSAMKSKRNDQRNEITSATKSPAQKHHQRNEITIKTTSPAQRDHHHLPHSTLYPLHTPHFTHCTLHFTLHTLHCTHHT